MCSVVSGFLEEVTFDECIGTVTVELVQSRVSLGQHVLKLVCVLEDLSFNHSVGLDVVNLAINLLVIFRLERKGRLTDLSSLHLTEVRLFGKQDPLDLVEVELPA